MPPVATEVASQYDAMGQKQKSLNLLDHLIGAAKQQQGHHDAERFSRDLIDKQIDFRDLLDRQDGRPFAIEDSAGIDSSLSPRVAKVCSVAH
jgi:hypothetical protein